MTVTKNLSVEHRNGIPKQQGQLIPKLSKLLPNISPTFPNFSNNNLAQLNLIIQNRINKLPY